MPNKMSHAHRTKLQRGQGMGILQYFSMSSLCPHFSANLESVLFFGMPLEQLFCQTKCSSWKVRWIEAFPHYQRAHTSMEAEQRLLEFSKDEYGTLDIVGSAMGLGPKQLCNELNIFLVFI